MANKTVSWGNFATDAEAGRIYADEITVQVQEGFDPAPGVTLTIGVQPGGSGAGGTFLNNGQASIDVTTDAVGFASAGELRANSSVGSFTLTANGFLAGVIDPAPKSMTVMAPSGAPIATTMGGKTGDFQQTTPSTAVTAPWTVTVYDQYSAPFPGASVTFTAPAGTGTFAGSGTNTITVVSDGSGVASGGTFTRSAATGAFQVTATSAGLNTLYFTVNNAAPQGAVSITGEADASSNTGPAVIAAPASRQIGDLLQCVMVCNNPVAVAGWTNWNGTGSGNNRWRVYWRIADGTAADNFSANVGNTLWYVLINSFGGGVYDPTAPLQDWVAGSNTTTQTTVTNVAGETGYRGQCWSVGSGSGGTVGNTITGTGWTSWKSYDAYTVGAWMTFVAGSRSNINANQATLRPFSASGGGTSVAGAAWNIKKPGAAPVAAGGAGALQFCEV